MKRSQKLESQKLESQKLESPEVRESGARSLQFKVYRLLQCHTRLSLLFPNCSRMGLKRSVENDVALFDTKVDILPIKNCVGIKHLVIK
jgi:hypothetical protein